jgi:hypothetical protein
MRKMLPALLSGLLLSLALPSVGAANEFTDQVTKAFDDDLVKLSFRYRYEYVDSDRLPSNAAANTLKTSLTLAPKIDDWLFLVQVDDVRHLGSEKFNDTRNGNTSYPLVLDPEGTGLNQGFIRYTGFKNTPITVGRQAIVRANKRYIGGVEWRQNEQTYDAAAINFDNQKFSLFYSYVDNVSRIFGPDSGTPKRNLDSKTSLIDGSYTVAPWLKVFGYAYLLDFQDESASALSSETFGLRGTGKIGSADGLNVDYQAEYAQQEDYKDNPIDYKADYYLLEAKLNVSAFSFLGGYEVLQGDQNATNAGNPLPNGVGFQTPLATLHKFQGWADQFVVTPGGGIKDAYLGATANALGAKWSIYVHDFTAESGSQDYGQELDASALWKIGKYYSVLLKLASFDADDSWVTLGVERPDVTKAWVQLQASW